MEIVQIGVISCCAAWGIWGCTLGMERRRTSATHVAIVHVLGPFAGMVGTAVGQVIARNHGLPSWSWVVGTVTMPVLVWAALGIWARWN